MARASAAKEITLDQLGALREKTESISALLGARLKNHLNTLYPLLAPKRTFGKHLGSKDMVPRADESFAQFAEKFKQACASPFDLRPEVTDETLSAMENGIEIYPWEYSHDLAGKPLTITSPVAWAMTYRSDHSLSQMRSARGDRNPNSVRHFLANAVAIQVVLGRNPGVALILNELGYSIEAEAAPGLGKLTMLKVQASLRSFRPADELIMPAVKLSGVPAFIELIDTESVRNLADPLKDKLLSMV